MEIIGAQMITFLRGGGGSQHMQGTGVEEIGGEGCWGEIAFWGQQGWWGNLICKTKQTTIGSWLYHYRALRQNSWLEDMNNNKWFTQTLAKNITRVKRVDRKKITNFQNW